MSLLMDALKKAENAKRAGQTGNTAPAPAGPPTIWPKLDMDPRPVVDLDADNSAGTAGTGFAAAFTENGGPVHITDTDAAGRYVAQLRRALKPQGHVLLAGFAPAGPERCSGLVVARRSVDELDALFGADFHRLATEHETHRTPGGAQQAFLYALYRRAAA